MPSFTQAGGEPRGGQVLADGLATENDAYLLTFSEEREEGLRLCEEVRTEIPRPVRMGMKDSSLNSRDVAIKSEHLSLNGARIHLRRAGTGAPLLFLHGTGGVTSWLPCFDELAKERMLLVPDHPGFGDSDTPGWLFGMNDVAYCYLDFIEHLGLRDIDVIGHSLGGWIAAEVAIRNAHAFRSLTLIAPAGVRVKGVLSGDIFMWSAEERANNLFHDPGLAAQALATFNDPDLLETQLKNGYAAARLGWQPRLYNPELQRWLHRIKAPTKLIWGNEDKVLPVAFATAWIDALPQLKFAAIPLCGHLPHVERQSQTISLIRSFLAEAAS